MPLLGMPSSSRAACHARSAVSSATPNARWSSPTRRTSNGPSVGWRCCVNASTIPERGSRIAQATRSSASFGSRNTSRASSNRQYHFELTSRSRTLSSACATPVIAGIVFTSRAVSITQDSLTAAEPSFRAPGPLSRAAPRPGRSRSPEGPPPGSPGRKPTGRRLAKHRRHLVPLARRRSAPALDAERRLRERNLVGDGTSP